MPPKGGFLSPKAIGNRIKAKGLQKLRWYCEMCQKQCRDENGFKCHQTSEGHLRQMRVFAENPHSVMEKFSEEFEEYFVETLSRLHNTKRIQANIVYKEYIADKNHVHMNSTKWSTLTNFILYLGKKGLVVADETEKGWYISWIDRDPAVIARQQAADKKRKHDMDDEARRQKDVERRVQAAGGGGGGGASGGGASGMFRASDEAKVSLKIGGGDGSGVSSSSSSSLSDGALAKKPRVAVASAFGESSSSSFSSSSVGPGKVSALDAIMKQEALRKSQEAAKHDRELAQLQAEVQAEEAASSTSSSSSSPPPSSSSSSSSSAYSKTDLTVRKGYWLYPGLVVKVMNKAVGDGKFYKAKAVVLQVLEKYVAVVRTVPAAAAPPASKGSKLQLDQEDLETVVPKAGDACRVVNGCGRGCFGVVERLRAEDFCADVRVTGDAECAALGPSGGRAGESGLVGTILAKVEYEDVCKIREEGD
mmetsp:Transcript_59995/g.103349  ORF Transcript_59995/g.103349 Transcript_59995/m.103349 type:complete len:477 (-) Transcript_59995:228-1658(-)